MDHSDTALKTRTYRKNPAGILTKVGIGLLIALFVVLFYIALDANKYQAQARVVSGADVIGLNPTTESLDFGDLARGNRMVRTVILENNSPLPLYAVIVKTGSVSELMEISDNFFTLNPGETKRVEFNAYIPASAEIDHVYDGRVYLVKLPLVTM